MFRSRGDGELNLRGGDAGDGYKRKATQRETALALTYPPTAVSQMYQQLDLLTTIRKLSSLAPSPLFLNTTQADQHSLFLSEIAIDILPAVGEHAPDHLAIY